MESPVHLKLLILVIVDIMENTIPPGLVAPVVINIIVESKLYRNYCPLGS